MAKTQDLKQRLARILYDKSYLEGEFTLTSGRGVITILIADKARSILKGQS